jgi:NAD(P)-dependent dehydrogenase (short-subunit alcohol dehydrogenase family)
LKTWFITGASRGLGALIAQEALAKGDAVVATGRSAEHVAGRLGDHTNLLAVAFDVTKEHEARAAASAAFERFGSVDILVNNAGFGLLGAVEEATAEDVERVYQTNVFGLLKLIRAVLPQMRQQRSGRMLNFSSIGGYRGGAGFGVYCSSKFAVEGLTEALFAELSPLGIHVTAVEPQDYRTDFLDPSSLARSTNTIPDYDETAGKVRTVVTNLSHSQPGNPAMLAKGLIEFVDAAHPTVRLPLGSDTILAIEDKLEADSALIEHWRPISVRTDYQPI